MTTAAFLATTTADKIEPIWWLSIEGLRVRYGGPGVPTWSPADSGINQPVYDYLMKMPRFDGQSVEPMNGSCTPHGFEVELLDDADYLTGLFSIHDSTIAEAWVTTAIAAADVIIHVDDNTVFSVDTDAYIERETVRITDVNVDGVHITVTRGMYGSEAVAHALTDSQGNTRQVGVTDAPTFIATRKCWLREGRYGLDEVDHIEFPGYIDSITEDQGVWKIKASGFLSRLGKNLGAETPCTTLFRSLWGCISEDGRIATADFNNTTYWKADVVWTQDFPSSGNVKIDNEIIKYENKTITTLIIDNNMYGLGMISTPDATKNRGQFMQEIMGFAAWNAAQMPRSSQGDLRYYAPPPGMEAHEIGAEVRYVLTNEDFLATNQDPVLILYSMMVSTGLGTHGAFDVLPATWGLGYETTDIDWSGSWYALSVELAEYKLRFAIPKPVEAKEWIENNILRPFLLFLYETPDGTIGLGTLMNRYEAEQTASVVSITEDDLLSIPKFDPGSYPLGEFEWKVNYSPGEDEYYGTMKAIMGDTNEIYQSKAKKFGPLECSTFYDSQLNRGTGFIYGGTDNGNNGMLSHYIGTVWDRYATKPVPQVVFEISYARLADIQIGDPIKLTCSVTPSMRTGTRGLVTEYYQVVGITPKPQDSVIEIKAWQIGVRGDPYRCHAPAAVVDSYAAAGGEGGRPRISFSDGGLQPVDSAITAGFVAGDKIAFFDSTVVPLDGATGEVLTIYGVGSDYVDVTTVPDWVPSATDVMLPPVYSSQTTTQKAKWASMADANETLGAGNDTAHVRM